MYPPFTGGGFGARLVGRLQVTANSILQINVGGMGETQTNVLVGGFRTAQGGFNGGGTSRTSTDSLTGAGGGGASDVRIGSFHIDSRVVVAGGGGGGTSLDRRGGNGGLLGQSGGDGLPLTASDIDGQGGKGGSSVGGAGGVSAPSCMGANGQAGAKGVGGGATSLTASAGGGGFFGGGGGGRSCRDTGGGGGSSYVDTSVVTAESSTVMTSRGHGFITFTFEVVNPPIATQYCQPAKIESISPEAITTQGGSLITITGQGLKTPVYINGMAAEVLSTSSQSISFRGPSGTKGRAEVRVEGCGATSISSFEYDPDPVALPPATTLFPITGGMIEISGRFLANAKLALDGTFIPLSTNSDNLIVAVLPESSAGSKSLKISTSFGNTQLGLTFVAPPMIPEVVFPHFARGDQIAIPFDGGDFGTYSLKGDVPFGLSIDSKSGVLSGTLRSEGEYSFSVVVSNVAGVAVRSVTWQIDRPIPKARMSNVYYSSNKGSISASNQDSLNRLLRKVQPVAPKHLAATLTVSGGSGATDVDVSQVRHDLIRQYIERSGIKVGKLVSEPGFDNISSVKIEWKR